MQQAEKDYFHVLHSDVIANGQRYKWHFRDKTSVNGRKCDLHPDVAVSVRVVQK